ncbi:MAG: hypothetical protein K2X00_11000 [Nitrospiraceae bacterium]|nr:hypothetical protein [Nitrospiraceae bacterium]
MAVFELQGPDGKLFEVEAPDAQSAVAAFQKMPQTAQKPVDPIKQRALDQVSAERKASPMMTAVDDTVRNLARGTGLGSWLDEANAATASILPEMLGGRPYDEALAYERAKNELADKESTVVGKLPVIGDVTVGGLTKLAGGIASAPATPMARVFQGATLAPRVGNAALTGAGYGALYGAGEGEGVADRATDAAMGAAIGGAIGVAAPLIASGVSNTVAAARNRMSPIAPEVAGYDRNAVNRLTRVAQDSGVNLQVARSTGSEGMLADANAAFRDVTEAVAQQPGRQRQVVQAALEQRAEGAPRRIRSALNAELGAPVDLRAMEQAIRTQYNQQAAPFYRQFYQTQIPVDQNLVGILQAVPDDVWPRVNRMMRMERVDPNNVVNTGHGIDLIKRSLDDSARAAGRGTNEERLYSNLARDLREHVDNLLSPGNPAQSPWAQGRAIAGEGIGGREALETGSRVFSSKADPQQLRADMAGMSAFERDMMRAGGRADLRNVMGRAATNFGPNGDAAARRALNSEYNRQNVRVIAGHGPADRLLNTIDAESEFATTANQALSNSATARRQAGRDIVPRQYDQSNAAQLRGTSLTGIIAEGAARIANIVTAGALNERNARIATDMARMLVASGAHRDEVVRGLMAEARKQGLTNQQRARIRTFVRDVVRGTSPAAIDATTGE